MSTFNKVVSKETRKHLATSIDNELLQKEIGILSEIGRKTHHANSYYQYFQYHFPALSRKGKKLQKAHLKVTQSLITLELTEATIFWQF